MYVDPNAPVPDTQSTRPSSAMPLGDAGAGLGELIEAADSGNLRVDEATGAATIQAIRSIQDNLDAYRRLTGNTQLGGGYAEQIDQFNRAWAVDGEDSAAAIMRRFDDELCRLREAVEKCLATYEATDDSGERRVNQAGGGQ